MTFYLTGAAPPASRHLLDLGMVGLMATPKTTGIGLAGFPLTWQAVLGQFIVKTALAALVALGIVSFGRREVAI